VVHNVILSILEKQLQIPSGTFTSIHKLTQPSGDFVRVLNYPVPKDGKPLADPPTPPHRDAVSVALLFTWQGGLQITNAPNEYKRLDTELDPEESWFYVPPIPGHVIMNLGDVMHIMTNGLLNSGKHRVVTPPGLQGKHQRLSVLLVARPWEEAKMRTVDSPLVRPGQYLDTEQTAKEWGKEKVLRIIGLADKAKSVKT
jgi:isopenicillin N synthase-like dioxygenase